MKELFFIIIFLIYFVYTIETDILTLEKYKKITYINENEKLIVLDTSEINTNEIYITFTNFNESFTSDSLSYNFINNYPNEDFDTSKIINSYNKKSFNNGQKVYYKIKKESDKYLVFKSIKCNNGNSIEVENTEKPGISEAPLNSPIVIVIIIVSISVVIIIVVIFIFVGKYIYNKRQKELMANYASSFVGDNNENPSLVPNDKKENEDDNNEKLK